MVLCAEEGGVGLALPRSLGGKGKAEGDLVSKRERTEGKRQEGFKGKCCDERNGKYERGASQRPRERQMSVQRSHANISTVPPGSYLYIQYTPLSYLRRPLTIHLLLLLLPRRLIPLPPKRIHPPITTCNIVRIQIVQIPPETPKQILAGL